MDILVGLHRGKNKIFPAAYVFEMNLDTKVIKYSAYAYFGLNF